MEEPPMSQLARHASYLLIEDQLDAVGQKYRVQQIVRGLLLWGCAAVACSLAAALAAHLLGQSNWTRTVLAAWITWMAVSALWWVGRPLLMRPRAAAVARLVEQRIG